MVGLFASTAYTRPVDTIPLLRRKLEFVFREGRFDPQSHSGRALDEIIEGYPRDELFQIDAETLFGFAVEILSIYDRPRVRVLARPDRFDRFVSVLVFVPREKYNSDVRARIGARLAEAYQGRVSAFQPAFLEGVPLTRVHFIIGRDEGPTPHVDVAALEREVAGEVLTWDDRLRTALLQAPAPLDGRSLAPRYARAFSAGYREAFPADEAVRHIARIEQLTPEHPFHIHFEAIPRR